MHFVAGNVSLSVLYKYSNIVKLFPVYVTEAKGVSPIFKDITSLWKKLSMCGKRHALSSAGVLVKNYLLEIIICNFLALMKKLHTKSVPFKCKLYCSYCKQS